MNTPGQDRQRLLRRFLGSHQWERALATAREILVEDPESLEAQSGAGQALVQLEQNAEALKHLETALAKSPESSRLHRLASRAHYALGRRSQADEAIQRAIELAPNDGESWQHLAWMCYRDGDLEDGLRWAVKARDLNPRDPAAWNMMALCQRDVGTGRELKRQYALEARRLSPQDSGLINNEGVELLQRGDLPGAEDCFRRALALSPKSKLVQKNLFLVLRRRDPIYRVLGGWSLLRGSLAARLVFFCILAFGRLAAAEPGNPEGGVVALWIWGVVAVVAISLWPIRVWYEHLTLVDIRAAAGEIGVRRGGWLGYRRWPLGVRLGIFATGVVLAVSAFVFLVSVALAASHWKNLLGVVAVCGIAGLLIAMRLRRAKTGWLANWWRRRRRRSVLGPLAK